VARAISRWRAAWLAFRFAVGSQPRLLIVGERRQRLGFLEE
jgi:hypothetical protein